MTAITWTGGAGDNNFDNALNWSPQQVPTSADTVTIDPAAATSIGFSVGSNAVQSLSTNSFVTLNLSNQETFTIGTSAATTFTNGGTFALNSGNQNTDLIVGATSLTLNGGGTIALDNNAGNRIYGAAAGDVLNNVNNLIQGAGQLGAGQLTFINGASGTVNADQANALVLSTGSNVVSNSGLLESTTGGGLVISSTTVNNGAGGHVSGAGGDVFLQGGTLQGGTLSSSGSGAIVVQGGQTGGLDGTTNTIVNTGSVDVNNQGTLTAIGTITNNGTIALQSSNQNTDFVIGAAGLTLNGTGTLAMSNNAGNRIYGAAGTDVLTNSTDVIQGAGQLGAGQLTFINSTSGTVDANLATSLVLNTGANVVTNNGLLESTSTGGLVIVSTTVNNATHGLVSAAGGNVYLQGATLQGGTLSSSGAAAIVVQGSETGTLDGTAHKVTNTGTIDVNNQGTLSVLNSIVNDSLIALQSVNQTTELLIDSATVTLTGAGTITLTDNGNNYIEGAATTDLLDNVNNLIEGSGHLGNGTLSLTNGAAGIIDASNTTNRLLLNTGTNVASNSGLIEATGAAGLQIQSTVNNGTTGTVEANGASATVYLDGGTIAGGTLVTANGGLFRVESSNTGTLNGSTNAVLNLGNFDLNNQASLTLLGSIVNQGVITIGSSNQNTDLIIDTSTVTLTGAGTISLSNNGGNRIYGAVATNVLDNVNNTITGAGQLGVAQLTLINGAAGIIDASAATALTINTAGETVTNSGLIEATGTGNLVVQSTTIDSSSGGTILASGGNVVLNGSTLAGGTINSSSTNAIVINSGQTATLDGSAHTITNLGTVDLENQSTLSLLGTIDNVGTINILSSNQATDLLIGPTGATPGTVTLTGGGVVTLSNNAGNIITGSIAGDTLVNLNNTISGAGHLGSATQQLILVNDATINASDAIALVVQTDSGAVTNNGLMESTSSGGLVIVSTTVSNASGTVAAAGGNVFLQSGTIAGGLVTSSGGAALVVQGGQTGTLDGSVSALTNTGSVDVNNQGTLAVLGSIVNDGTIALQSSNQLTELLIDNATVTLTGSGTISLSNNGGNAILGASAADVLDNVNNTITGAGQLGDGQLTLINGAAGIIDASTATALVLNTGSIAATNSGLMESTSTGGLVLETVVNDGASGQIAAAGGNVFVQGGTIEGGTLSSSGGAAFIIQGGRTGTLDGTAHAVTNTGNFDIQNQGTLTVLGSIVNSGTIALQSSNQSTDLIIASSTVTLSGGGTITMSDNGGNRIYGLAATDVLDNVNNTIEGAGQFGDGTLTLINGGIIEAVGNNALTIDLGSTGMNLASGELLGVGAGGLSITNGTYTNLGLIQADNGSHVTFSTGATLTNSVNGTLTGGTYGAVASGNGATLSITGSAITDLAADLILSGVGSTITFGGTAIENSLTTIARTGELQVLNDRDYTTTKKITNSGTLALGGGVFTAKGLNDHSTALLTGFGTLAASLTSSGAIVATGGTLELDGHKNTISGTESGTGTLAFGGTTTLNVGTVLDVSNIAMISKATLNIDTPLSFAGTFDIEGKATIAGTAAFTSSGLFEQTGNGLASVNDAFTNSGTVQINSGGTLAFSGGLANTGLILDNGAFTDTAALTGGSLDVGGHGTAAVIASGAGAGNSTVSTLTVGGGTLNTSGTTLTVTGDYNNTAAGVGNSYNPFAGVTGTIDGQGTQLAVIGVDGTTITTVNGTLTITVAPGGTASFEIENTGAPGSAALRGALQTTVNGGNITGHALSGSGVTAQDYGPILAGGTSGVFTIDYSHGNLNNEAIHIASDFANVAGLTIDIVAGAASTQPPGASAPAYIANHNIIATHDAFGWMDHISHPMG